MNQTRYTRIIFIQRHFIPALIKIEHLIAADDIQIVLIRADGIEMISVQKIKEFALDIIFTHAV